MIRVLALGTFDLLHPGHVNFLAQARELGDELWVAANPDDFAERYKKAPVMTLEERLAMLRALAVVDLAFPNYGAENSGPAIDIAAFPQSYGLYRATPEKVLIVHGDDWTGDSYLKQLGVDLDFLHDHNAEIVYVPYTEGISTSAVVDRIRPARDPGRLVEDVQRVRSAFPKYDDADEEERAIIHALGRVVRELTGQ